MIFLIFNAVVGLILFEYAYHSVRRFRNPNKDLDEIYPCYRRRDAMNWNKFKFYPGAIFLLVPRFLFLVVILFIAVILTKILMIGHDRSKPITGTRNGCIRFWY